MRSLENDTGVPGTPQCQAKLYLFDIRMNSGKNFRDVRSVYYDGTNKGIADIVLTDDAVTFNTIAALQQTNRDGLLFSAGVESLKNANAVTYTYRTIDQTVTMANTGLFTKSIAGNPNEFYASVGEGTDDDLRDLYLVPWPT